MLVRARFAHIALREVLFLFLSLSGAVVFLNHQVLYLTGDGPSSLSWMAYAVSTVLIYAFLRGIFLAGTMHMSPRVAEPTECPECGRPPEDGTPIGARWLRKPDDVSTAIPRPNAVRLAVPLARPIVSRTPLADREVVNPRLDFLLLQGMRARNPPASTNANGLMRQSEPTGPVGPPEDP